MKKLIVFLLFAFLPMIAVGIFLHASAGSADASTTDPVAALTGFLFSAGAMLIPLLAVLFTQLIFKEPVFRNMGISFKFNRWWWIGWLLMPVVALAVLGVTLLMPGARWTPDSEMIQMTLAQMPEGFGVWGIIGISLVSGLITGATLNAVFGFGEEIAWRGFLMKEFKGMMPVIDGFEVIRRLKGDPATADINIVILSALNSNEDIVKGFSLGANDFIMKPIIMERLLTCITTQLQLVEAKRL